VQPKGQLSFEYLLLTAAFFSLLLVFGGALSKIRDAGFAAAECTAAKEFSNSFRDAANSLSIYGAGSSKALSGRALGKWALETGGNSFSLIIDGSEHCILPEVRVSAEFSRESIELESAFSLTLEKVSPNTLSVVGN